MATLNRDNGIRIGYLTNLNDVDDSFESFYLEEVGGGLSDRLTTSSGGSELSSIEWLRINKVENLDFTEPNSRTERLLNGENRTIKTEVKYPISFSCECVIEALDGLTEEYPAPYINTSANEPTSEELRPSRYLQILQRVKLKDAKVFLYHSHFVLSGRIVENSLNPMDNSQNTVFPFQINIDKYFPLVEFDNTGNLANSSWVYTNVKDITSAPSLPTQD